MQEDFEFDELVAFSVSSIDKNDYVNALAYAKRALALNKTSEQVRFLLASIHAQLGLKDKAVDELTELCNSGCTIPEAYFQLGLIYFLSGDIDSADRSWSKLDQGNNRSEYLVAFKNGLLSFEHGKNKEAIHHIDKGISISTNLSLVNDMSRIRDIAKSKLSDDKSTELGENLAEKEISKSQSHLFVNAYKDT